MKRLLIPVALSVIAASSCERNENPPARPDEIHRPTTDMGETKAVDAPQSELSEAQLKAMAFRAAWGSAPPVQVVATSTDSDARLTYRKATLVPIGASLFALVSEGQAGDAHVDVGALSVHYLRHTPAGFQKIGAWREIANGGSWGAPPEWGVRHDLMPGPVLVTSGGGTWQGYTCQWADVVELTPQRPVLRAEGLRLLYGSGGALGDQGESYEGELKPGLKGQTFAIDYGENDVTYAKVGDTYDPVDPPDMPWC